MAMARPRIRVGKISERTTQTTGPMERAKQAMKPRMKISTHAAVVLL